jgi:hypothetical protein
VHILHSFGEGYGLESGIGDALAGAQLVGICLGSTLVRDDGNGSADGLSTTEGDLGCKASAQSGVPRKGQLCDAFKDRRLAAVCDGQY